MKKLLLTITTCLMVAACSENDPNALKRGDKVKIMNTNRIATVTYGETLGLVHVMYEDDFGNVVQDQFPSCVLEKVVEIPKR